MLGSGNHFTTSGISADDQTSDSPTDSADDGIGNYCTFNPIGHGAVAHTFSNGNLGVDNASNEGVSGTMFVNSGKWYFELTPQGGTVDFLGIVGSRVVSSGDLYDTDPNTSGMTYGSAEVRIYYSNTGAKADDTSSSAYGDAWAGQVMGCAFDADAGTLWFSKAGTWQNSATIGEIAAGTTTNAAFTNLDMTDAWTVLVGNNAGGVQTINTGQTAFTYTVPTGYTGWNTSHLPAPAVKDASSSFTTHGYTGTGSAHDETFGNNTSMDPDLVIIKNRDTTDAWNWVDSVRGATKELNSNSTAIESTDANGVDDLSVTDGFGLGSGAAGYNDNNEDFISYNWKAGGAGSSNEDGSINTIKTSVNATAGFSISTYTGTGANATIGHGLNNAPKWVVIKKFSGSADSWHVYHAAQASDPQTDYLVLNTNAAIVDSAAVWNDTAPTSSVVSLGTDTGVNGDGVSYISYCWEEIEGFSKFGVFTGNSNVNGPYVFCNFAPSLVIIKRTDAARVWRVYDITKIIPGNDAFLELDGTTVDSDSSTNVSTVDFLANGFKLRGNSSHLNAGNLVFMAFAEHPFGGLGVSQARAR